MKPDGGPAFPVDSKAITWYIPFNKEEYHAVQMVSIGCNQKTGSNMAVQKALPIPANAYKCQEAQQDSPIIRLVGSRMDCVGEALSSLLAEIELAFQRRDFNRSDVAA